MPSTRCSGDQPEWRILWQVGQRPDSVSSLPCALMHPAHEGDCSPSARPPACPPALFHTRRTTARQAHAAPPTHRHLLSTSEAPTCR